MLSARLLQNDEKFILREMLYSNPKSNGVLLSKREIDSWSNKVMLGVKNKSKIVTITIENGDPIGFSLGHKKPNVAGWIQGLTLIKTPGTYASHSIERLAPAMDLLVEQMEELGYYKFWDITLRTKITIVGRKILSKFTKTLNRYEYYDEFFIPPAKKSGVKLWDINRRIHPTDEITVGMFVLKNDFRHELLSKKKDKR
jgi:hypothetical protein